MRKAFKLSLLLSVLLSSVGCDQATKLLARNLLTTSNPTSLLNGVVRFEYVENPGAFLGLGAQLPATIRLLIFVVFTAMLLAAMLLLVIKERAGDPKQLVGMALLVGGGTGNLIDRIANDGRVVDFVSFGVGSLRTGILNVADVAVFAGALLLLFGLLRKRETQARTT